MLLQPRKFKYKSRQKLRRATQPAIPKLSYGNVALILLRPLRLSAKKIFRIKLFLKKSARRSDITHRAFWVSVFPHLPLSKKPKGMRMGKGAGKLSSWQTQIRSGKSMVEFRNLRLGRAAYFGLQVGHKLPVPSMLLTSPTRNLKIVKGSRVNPLMLSYW